jgi:hypothetical protein
MVQLRWYYIVKPSMLPRLLQTQSSRRGLVRLGNGGPFFLQPLPPHDCCGRFAVKTLARTVFSTPHLHRTSMRSGDPWVPSLR